MQRFTTAKLMLGLVILVGWIVVTIAVIGFFLPVYEAALWMKIAGLVISCFSGFMLVAVGQMGLAQIATAENTRRMIELLEASQKGVNRQSPPVASRAPKVEPVFSKSK